MNKFILLFLIVLAPVFAKSQQITTDKVYQDGSRLIEAECLYIKNGFTDRNPIGISIAALIDSCSNANYFLHLHINSMKSYTIPKDGIILFKTNNDQVFEANQGWESYKTKDIVGTYIPYAGRIHVAEGIYPMSNSDLGSLATMGVKKIRIETEFENIDINYSEKKSLEFGKYIHNC